MARMGGGGVHVTSGGGQTDWRHASLEPTVATWRQREGRQPALVPVTGAVAPGGTDMARAFGAEVAVDSSPRGLYLVVGHTAMPVHAVRGAGGEIVVGLEARNTLLAVLDLDCHPLVAHHPDVALAGPVTIDPERFARFVALAGLDSTPQPTPNPTS